MSLETQFLRYPSIQHYSGFFYVILYLTRNHTALNQKPHKFFV